MVRIRVFTYMHSLAPSFPRSGLRSSGSKTFASLHSRLENDKEDEFRVSGFRLEGLGLSGGGQKGERVRLRGKRFMDKEEEEWTSKNISTRNYLRFRLARFFYQSMNFDSSDPAMLCTPFPPPLPPTHLPPSPPHPLPGLVCPPMY